MPEKCGRCEQLEQLAAALQDALKNTFRVLMVSLDPGTSDERRAEILAELERGHDDGPSDTHGTPGKVGEASGGPSTPSDAKKG